MTYGPKRVGRLISDSAKYLVQSHNGVPWWVGSRALTLLLLGLLML